MSGEAHLQALSRPVRYRTKQELVYRALREAIMRCELPPGHRLVIDDLARQLEVSAIPVREALQLLQSEGLVTNVPHVGATVSPISREAIHEVFTVMEGLEIVATRTAAERMTGAEATGLEEVVALMDAALRSGRHHEWADLNTRFHLTISRLSAMPTLSEMTERVLSHWDRLRRYYFNGVLIHRVDQAQEEHRALLRLMQEKDLPALEQMVKRHNQGALLAYAEYLRQQGSPG
jgi:DNA-binding GntR family transcriptional regulator